MQRAVEVVGVVVEVGAVIHVECFFSAPHLALRFDLQPVRGCIEGFLGFGGDEASSWSSSAFQPLAHRQRGRTAADADHLRSFMA